MFAPVHVFLGTSIDFSRSLTGFLRISDLITKKYVKFVVLCFQPHLKLCYTNELFKIFFYEQVSKCLFEYLLNCFALPSWYAQPPSFSIIVDPVSRLASQLFKHTTTRLLKSSDIEYTNGVNEILKVSL